MMEKLEGTLSQLSSRVDTVAKIQLPKQLEGAQSQLSSRVDTIDKTQLHPRKTMQDTIVDMQIEEASGDQVQQAQNLMAKLQAASAKKDSATGVASAETHKAAALHSEPERTAEVATASKIFETIFRKEEAEKKAESAIDTTKVAKRYAMKQQLLKLLGKMDSQEHMQLAGLKSFHSIHVTGTIIGTY